MHDRSSVPFRERLFSALQHGLVLFLYLWVLLTLFVLHDMAASRTQGDQLILHGFVLLNALALTKVMLPVEHMDLGGWLAHHPRVCSVLFDSAVCAVLFLLAHTLERVIVGLFHGHPISASMPTFGGGGMLGVLIIGMIFFVSLLPFFTFKAVARVIGPDRILSILFGRPAPAAKT